MCYPELEFGRFLLFTLLGITRISKEKKKKVKENQIHWNYCFISHLPGIGSSNDSWLDKRLEYSPGSMEIGSSEHETPPAENSLSGSLLTDKERDFSESNFLREDVPPDVSDSLVPFAGEEPRVM